MSHENIIEGRGGTVRATVAEGVADVALNRPAKLNALTAEMFADLLEVGLLVRDRSDVRAVVLSGSGRGFCAGLDLGAFAAMEQDTDWRKPTTELLAPDDPLFELNRGQRAAAVWGTVAAPVIAAVHGPAFGGGLQIALHADIRILAPSARLCVAEARWGLVPDMGGTQLLPRLVGTDVAMELTCTARTFSGAEAAELGLATRTSEDPHAAALELATTIAGHNPDAIRASKALLTGSWELSLRDGLAAERTAMARIARSPNQREAVRAQQENRQPEFTDPSAGADRERTHHA
ncbi:MAG TPA: crotonase/enoyl-CoA hydratase family protein [Pseudonocardia sp.]|nr:crotonase/enoyl-CoA hydratase family protein [Pseudonocardia sp.]